MRQAVARLSGSAAGRSGRGSRRRTAAGQGARRARSLAALAVPAVISVLVAGCTAGASSPAVPATSGSAPASAARATGPAESVPALPSRALASPGCSSAVAAGPALGSVRTATVQTGGTPFGVATTPDGRWAFVAATGGSVDVLRLRTGKSGAPIATLVRSISLPEAPFGAAVTPDGKYLLLAAGSGAMVVSVARAEAGTAGAVLGTLAAPAGTLAANSATQVAVSPDSRFAFVTLEYADEAVVFNLAAAVSHGFGAADYVGAIPLGHATVGMAVSPDGRWLYATSEVVVPAQHPVGLSLGRCTGSVPGTEAGQAPGTLTVIELRRAETDPAHSVVATVDAGYQPVRVVTSADGTRVWVTARASDDLLCFSAARLASDPARALVAVVRVGSEPVGLAAVRGGTQVVVADSNRYGAAGASSDLTVVNVAAALAGRPAVAGDISTGLFPRDMAVSPSGTLLVSDFSSGDVQAVDTATLPGAG